MHSTLTLGHTACSRRKGVHAHPVVGGLAVAILGARSAVSGRFAKSRSTKQGRRALAAVGIRRCSTSARVVHAH